MAADKEFPVHGDNGLHGVLLAPARFLDDSPERKIRLDDGRELTVPADLLEPQRDVSFYLLSEANSATSRPAEEVPVPEVQPVPQVQPVQQTQEEPPMPKVPDEPLLREDCEVERVSVRKLLDKPAETRQEGDTLIVPLMEEIWVVEKRLMLREELHIKRKTTRYTDPKPIRRDELE